MALAVLVAMAVPNIQRGWETLRADRTAFTIAQTLRTAHTLAVTQSHRVTWTWNADRHQVSLGIPSSGTSTAPSTSSDESSLKHLTRPLTIRDVPVTVQPGTGSSSVSADTVVFFPDGTSQTTTLLIGDPASPRYHILVDGTTGRVTVQAGPPIPAPAS